MPPSSTNTGDALHPDAAASAALLGGTDASSSSSSSVAQQQTSVYGTSPIIPNIPPRGGGGATSSANASAFQSESTTPNRGLSPKPSQSAIDYFGTSPGNSNTNSNNPSGYMGGDVDHNPLTEAQKARIVARHLVDREGQVKVRKETESGKNSRSGSSSTPAAGAGGVGAGPSSSTGPSFSDLKGKMKAAIGAGKQVDDQVLEDDEEEQQQQGEGGPSNAQGGRRSRRGSSRVQNLSPDEFPMPFGLQGGDITHEIYKWQRNAIANSPSNPKKLKRSKSTGELSNTSAINLRGDEESGPVGGAAGETANGGGENGAAPDDNDFSQDMKLMREPGGMRRNFINRKIDRQVAATPPNARTTRPPPQRRTGSFVDFLSLYGHLAGEDLEEIEEEDEDLLDEDEEEEEAALEAAERGIPEGTVAARSGGANERTPLLKRNDTRARIAKKRLSMQDKRGDATVLQAVLMLLKSFVGTGILFLGRAFFNGGMLFSIVVLLSIAMISLFSFLLLGKARLVVPGSFGDMGGVLYGPWLRFAILTSITLSQIGFVAAYTIFVAENLQSFVMAVSNCRVYIPIAVMIFSQMVFYLPLAMFRNIHKLSGTALVADAFILIGIIYIVYLEVGHLKEFGLGDIVMFNKNNFPLLIGTAVFSFEGVGLVIPITEAMKEPEKFPKVLSGVMIFVALLFGGAGALGYATFGKDIQTVVLVNLPQDDRFVNVVQFLYSIAIMLSTPLQLFPAVRIMEQGIFSASGKYSNKIKWEKNIFRSLTVLGCSFISWAGARDLDKFVSLIGSTACVPLCFCYPAMLHYKACAKSRTQKAIDIVLVLFGVAMAIYTSIQTIQMLAKGEKSAAPKFGKCPAPKE